MHGNYSNSASNFSSAASSPFNRIVDALIEAGLIEDILPILPPDAVLTEGSAVKESDRGKVPGLFKPERACWTGFPKWTQHTTTPTDVELWRTWPDAGLCLQTRQVRGWDIDVDERELADRIEALILSRVKGRPPIRRRDGSNRRMIFVRVLGVMFKDRTAFTLGGQGHAVEFLGNGQQGVLAGRHPKGGAYRLEGSFGDTPELSQAEADALMADIERLIVEAGGVILERSEHRKARDASGPTNPRGAVIREIMRRRNYWVPCVLACHEGEEDREWRLSSEELGRELQEDLAVYPTGIYDFGSERPLNPIELIREFGALHADGEIEWGGCPHYDPKTYKPTDDPHEAERPTESQAVKWLYEAIGGTGTLPADITFEATLPAFAAAIGLNWYELELERARQFFEAYDENGNPVALTPPEEWSADELRHNRNRLPAMRALNPKRFSELWKAWGDKTEAIFDPEPQQQGPSPEQKEPTIKLESFVWRNPATLPRRQFVYGTHLIRKFLSTTSAPGGMGKSMHEIAEALAMVSGKPLLGVQPNGLLRVFYWNGEDPYEEIERRVLAVMQHYGLTQEDIGDRFIIKSGRDGPIKLAMQDRDGIKVAYPLIDELTKTLIESQIDASMIDPFISSHQVPENDNNAIDLVAKTWAAIADRTNSAIDLVHHTRKTGGNGVTVEDMRGAVALVNAARSARTLNPATKEEASKMGLVDPGGIYRIGGFGDESKSNLGPKEGPRWYRLQSVMLPNGDPFAANPYDKPDYVGVPVLWTPPTPKLVEDEDIPAVLDAIRSGGPWKHNPQADNWVGIAIGRVLGLNIADKAARAQVSTLIGEWIAKGVLVRVERMCPNQRKLKPFVEVATGVDDDDAA